MSKISELFGRRDGSLDWVKVMGAIGFLAILVFQAYALWQNQPFNASDFCTGLSLWGTTTAGGVRTCSRTRKGILTGIQE